MNPPVLEMSPVQPQWTDKSTGGPIRLNLGGRETRIEGFLNVDLYQSKNTDIVSDCSDLKIIDSGSVDEIYASNILEHWPHVQTVKVLTEWRRVLKKGGKCFISVPDFDATVKLYLREGLVPWVVNLCWGDQLYPLAYHYINFTWPLLALCITKAGFSDVKRIPDMPYGIKDASRHSDNHGHEISIALNVEATA